MAFLIPALCAVVSDVFLLYLNHAYNRRDAASYEPQAAEEAPSFITHVGYLAWLAVIRLLLVMFPLTYHSYTGTAVKFPKLYGVLYVTTLLLVFAHSISIIMLDPSSLTTLLPTNPNRRTIRRWLEEVAAATAATTSSSMHSATMRHVWIELSLTLWSTLWHCVLLWHVRSTAPHELYAKRRREYDNSSLTTSSRRKHHHVLYYYASQQQQQQQARGEESTQDIEQVERTSLLTTNMNVEATAAPDAQFGERKHDLIQQMKCLPDNYDEFVSDLQKRLQAAKQQWTERLEEVTIRMSAVGSSHGSSIHRSSMAGGTTTTAASSSFQLQLPSSITPFRVLLQLFAYEEVLTNHRLDHVFEVDGGEALTFYVPQLLSFLLYGAYHNSPTLENWILQKCQDNVHFAHRCYWFLRAWCLETQSPQTNTLGSTTGSQHGSSSSLHQYFYRNSNNASQTSLSSRASINSVGEGLLRLGGSSAEVAAEAAPQQQQESSKFLPEERCLIEALLFRVMECGELSATTLQYGPSAAAAEDEEESATMDLSLEEAKITDSSSPSSLMAATESGLIPVDPNTGFPSVAHMDSVAAQRKYGFLPMDDQHRPHDVEHNGGGDHSKGDPLVQASEEQQWFVSTPRFLDALTTLADNLFLLPREHRLSELRRQLRSLEVEFLPSNVVYVPIHNLHHRVWRIVADESIAISTKERVPCIIYLEVVNYAAKKPVRKLGFLETALRRSMHEEGQQQHVAPESPTKAAARHSFLSMPAHATEREVIDHWQHMARDPQRHNSLFDKVSNFTQKGLKRLREQQNQDVLLWGNNMRHSWAPITSHSSAHRDDSEQEQGGGDVDADAGADIEAPVSEDRETQVDDDDDAGRNGSRPPLAPLATRPPRAVSMPEPMSPPPAHRQQHDSTIMGQWSSPTSTTNVQRRRAERRAERRREQNAATEGQQQDTDVMGALVGIRNRMERAQQDATRSSSGSLSSDVAPSTTTSSTPLKYGTAAARSGEPSSAAAQTTPKRTTRPPPVVFKESFAAKQERVRSYSAYGSHPDWRLLPILIKSNDDLRQEQLASQLIHKMASILARSKVPVWLCPYEIVALTSNGGIIEAIPDTISLDSLKRNDPHFTTLSDFFTRHFGDITTDSHADAKACFVESLSAYSMVCYLMQIKDRHNGNILLDNQGHLIHIDFGFFFLSSPGQNSGFESAPFKLTRDFVDLMDGPDSRTFKTFRELCCRTFLALRRHWYEISLLVEMLIIGNEELSCFRGRPDDAVRGLRERFRLDLNDRACVEYVNALVDESLENWRTRWYDRYQRYCVGVL